MSQTEEPGWIAVERSMLQHYLSGLFMSFDALEPKASAELQVLVGVGVSLWRAVSLADEAILRPEVRSDAKSFLMAVMDETAIASDQTINMRSCTFGYYLDNALFRLSLLHRQLDIQTEAAERIEGYIKIQTASVSGASSLVMWDTALAAAEGILVLLQDRYAR